MQALMPLQRMGISLVVLASITAIAAAACSVDTDCGEFAAYCDTSSGACVCKDAHTGEQCDKTYTAGDDALIWTFTITISLMQFVVLVMMLPTLLPRYRAYKSTPLAAADSVRDVKLQRLIAATSVCVQAILVLIYLVDPWGERGIFGRAERLVFIMAFLGPTGMVWVSLFLSYGFAMLLPHQMPPARIAAVFLHWFWAVVVSGTFIITSTLYWTDSGLSYDEVGRLWGVALSVHGLIIVGPSYYAAYKVEQTVRRYREGLEEREGTRKINPAMEAARARAYALRVYCMPAGISALLVYAAFAAVPVPTAFMWYTFNVGLPASIVLLNSFVMYVLGRRTSR